MPASTTLVGRLMAPRPDRPAYRPLDRGGRCHTVVVAVRGDLDATGIDDFNRVLDVAFATCYHGVVVDLSETDFMSIGAAAQLAEAKRRAVRSRLDMALVSSTPAVAHVLQVTGLRPLFGEYPSIRAAVSAESAVEATDDREGLDRDRQTLDV